MPKEKLEITIDIPNDAFDGLIDELRELRESIGDVDKAFGSFKNVDKATKSAKKFGDILDDGLRRAKKAMAKCA